MVSAFHTNHSTRVGVFSRANPPHQYVDGRVVGIDRGLRLWNLRDFHPLCGRRDRSRPGAG